MRGWDPLDCWSEQVELSDGGTSQDRGMGADLRRRREIDSGAFSRLTQINTGSKQRGWTPLYLQLDRELGTVLSMLFFFFLVPSVIEPVRWF